MRFSQDRADTFARYTLTALLNEGKARDGSKFILWMRRSELASILGMTNSRQEHVQQVADLAAKEGIVTAIAPGWVYFMYDEDTETCGEQLDVADAKSVTDEFMRVYGSKAIDEMWDEGTYRSQAAATEASKPKGRPSKRLAVEE